jgi:hypothetical protein
MHAQVDDIADPKETTAMDVESGLTSMYVQHNTHTTLNQYPHIKMITFILFREQHKADKDVSGSGRKDYMTGVPSTGVTPDCESVELTGLTKETEKRFVYMYSHT